MQLSSNISLFLLLYLSAGFEAVYSIVRLSVGVCKIPILSDWILKSIKFTNCCLVGSQNPWSLIEYFFHWGFFVIFLSIDPSWLRFQSVHGIFTLYICLCLVSNWEISIWRFETLQERVRILLLNGQRKSFELDPSYSSHR